MTEDRSSKKGASSKLVEVDRQPTVFGQLIKELRADRGISQAALARAVGISPGYVGLLEVGDRGERTNLEIVKKFGQALNCTVEETELLMRATGHLGQNETLLHSDRPTFAAFVSADKRLTRAQQDAIIAVYNGFVGKDAALLSA